MRNVFTESEVPWVQISRRLLGTSMTLRETRSGTTSLFTRWKTSSLSTNLIKTSTSMHMTSNPSSLNAKLHLVAIWLSGDIQLRKLSFVRYEQISLDCLVADKPTKESKADVLQTKNAAKMRAVNLRDMKRKCLLSEKSQMVLHLLLLNCLRSRKKQDGNSIKLKNKRRKKRKQSRGLFIQSQKAKVKAKAKDSREAKAC